MDSSYIMGSQKVKHASQDATLKAAQRLSLINLQGVSTKENFTAKLWPQASLSSKCHVPGLLAQWEMPMKKFGRQKKLNCAKAHLSSLTWKSQLLARSKALYWLRTESPLRKLNSNDISPKDWTLPQSSVSRLTTPKIGHWGLWFKWLWKN